MLPLHFASSIAISLHFHVAAHHVPILDCFSMLRAVGRVASLAALGRTSAITRVTPQLRHPSAIASLHRFDQLRWSSNANPQRKGFLGNLIDNVKEELEKNKELQVGVLRSPLSLISVAHSFCTPHQNTKGVFFSA